MQDEGPHLQPCPFKKARINLVFQKTGEIRQKGDLPRRLPLDDRPRTFIVNGVERVVVSQLVRSPGMYYRTRTTAPVATSTRPSASPTAAPGWSSRSTKKKILSAKIDRKRKILGTMLLRAIGYGSSEEIIEPVREGHRRPRAARSSPRPRQGHHRHTAEASSR